MYYSNMSTYYDTIMTSDYYDYEKIVDNLLDHLPSDNVLEIGCGTGLILEALAKRESLDSLTGIDLTESMLTIAEERLKQFSNVSLSLQNIVDLSLTEQYDLVFSYGGVWYFVIDGDNEPFLVSHLSEDSDNQQGFAQLTQHIPANGTLLLGIQGPHHDYEKTISNGMTYSQKITSSDDGFVKDYYLANDTETVMKETIKYRTYTFTEAKELLASHGFKYQHVASENKMFLEFQKV